MLSQSAWFTTQAPRNSARPRTRHTPRLCGSFTPDSTRNTWSPTHRAQKLRTSRTRAKNLWMCALLMSRPRKSTSAGPAASVFSRVSMVLPSRNKLRAELHPSDAAVGFPRKPRRRVERSSKEQVATAARRNDNALVLSDLVESVWRKPAPASMSYRWLVKTLPLATRSRSCPDLPVLGKFAAGREKPPACNWVAGRRLQEQLP